MISAISKWRQAGKIYFDKRMITQISLGFSSGFPLLLVMGTMNLWLKDSGITYAAIGLFSLVKIPYSLKWAWSPIIDRVKLPFFSRLGRRRGWAILTQIMLFISLLMMSLINPEETPWLLAWIALFVAFSSASQDIVLDAYRVESFDDKEQGAGAAVFVIGYRIGSMFSGAIALVMADYISWNNVYMIMSLGVFVGMAAVLFSKEPKKEEEISFAKPRGTFMQKVELFLRSAVAQPFIDFAKRPHWMIILIFIFLYKMSDAYVGPMAYPFYIDMGFSKTQIAAITKIYGVAATILGGIVGGLIVSRYGIFKALFICGIFMCLSNLMFAVQASVGYNVYLLIATISIENVSGGMATAAFVAYLASLTNILYTATQYALLSSFMSLARDLIAATSGYLKECVSWEVFFVITTIMGIPGLIILLYLWKANKKP